MTIISLGRYGDILNILPACYGMAKRGRRPTLVVSAQFADILDGVTYCDRKIYSGPPEDLLHVMGLCSQLPDVRVAQVNRNPDERHLEDSYCKESYRLSGLHGLWKRWPLVFDNRDKEREKKLFDQVFPKVYDIRPFIAVATNGVSSPFKHAKKLVEALRSNFPEMGIVSLDEIKAEKPYDLLGLLDAASCLVTVDTMHLHLANAAKCPTVSLLNEGWRGSVPPVTSVGSFRYSEFQVDQVTDCVENALGGAGEVWAIVDRFGQEKRHEEAFKAQSEVFGERLLRPHKECKTAKEIGDDKPLPSLKSMLLHALMFAQNRDIIFWTNDDVIPLDIWPMVNRARVFGACSSRRDPAHIGREMIAFRWDWLADRIHNFPECFVAAPWFDLAVAAWIRKQGGFISTLDNLKDDIYPFEIANEGLFVHPDHKSGWGLDSPAAKWNEKIYTELVR